jgi:hypothetical protein
VARAFPTRPGDKEPRLKPDREYFRDVDNINEYGQRTGEDYPSSRIPEIEALRTELRARPSARPDSVLQRIRQLRYEANQAYRSPEPHALNVAHAKRAAADALEGLMERELGRVGRSDLITRFQAARQMIARSYVVEAALNRGTHQVVARRIAAQRSRKPLTGQLETIANAFDAFPHALGPATGAEDYSVLDLAYMAASALHGHPGAAALWATRPLVRHGIMSERYQNFLTGQNRLGAAAQRLPQRPGPRGRDLGILPYLAPTYSTVPPPLGFTMSPDQPTGKRNQ